MVTRPLDARHIWDTATSDRDRCVDENAVDPFHRVDRAVRELAPTWCNCERVGITARECAPRWSVGLFVNVAGDDDRCTAFARYAPRSRRRAGGAHRCRDRGGCCRVRTWCHRARALPVQRRVDADPRLRVSSTSATSITRTCSAASSSIAPAGRPPVTTTRPDSLARAAHFERHRRKRGASWMHTTSGLHERITVDTACASSRNDRTL